MGRVVELLSKGASLDKGAIGLGAAVETASKSASRYTTPELNAMLRTLRLQRANDLFSQTLKQMKSLLEPSPRFWTGNQLMGQLDRWYYGPLRREILTELDRKAMGKRIARLIAQGELPRGSIGGAYNKAIGTHLGPNAEFGGVADPYNEQIALFRMAGKRHNLWDWLINGPERRNILG